MRPKGSGGRRQGWLTTGNMKEGSRGDETFCVFTLSMSGPCKILPLGKLSKGYTGSLLFFLQLVV